MNKIILLGRLARDPEVKQTPTINITRFTLAVDRRFKSEGQPAADFINCVAFGATADFISKYFYKGMKAAVEGRLQTGSYEKDGVKHYTTDVIVEAIEFAESKRSSEDTPGPGPDTGSEFMDIPDADTLTSGLPFK